MDVFLSCKKNVFGCFLGAPREVCFQWMVALGVMTEKSSCRSHNEHYYKNRLKSHRNPIKSHSTCIMPYHRNHPFHFKISNKYIETQWPCVCVCVFTKTKARKTIAQLSNMFKTTVPSLLQASALREFGFVLLQRGLPHWQLWLWFEWQVGGSNGQPNRATFGGMKPKCRLFGG